MDPSTRSALLVIDVQAGLDDPSHGERNNPGAERNMAALLAEWRRTGRPIVHVQHMSVHSHSLLRPELPGNAIKPEVAPQAGESVFHKTTNSAFIGTGLEAHLRARQVDTIVVVGLTTDHCVSSTARMASDLDFRTIVVSDATATHERRGPAGEQISATAMHESALASLQGEFAEVLATARVLDAFAG